MPAAERTRLQSARLRALVDRLLAAGGLQGQRLRQAGLTSGDGLSVDDLPRLPTTVKQDLWDSYPMGMLAVPPGDVVAVHGSSGTGGRPTLVAYTRGDLKLWSRMCARALGCAGATADSIVHNAYGYGLFTGGLGIHQGAIELGATVIPMSGGMTSRQVTLLTDLRADILTCTPSYALRLGEALDEAGAAHSLRAGLFGAEPWTDELRGRIEELLGIRALDIYGLSEVIGPGVAAECAEAADGLHVNEDHFLVEAVDPATGQPVPDGTPGELVFSTVTREALPLLRYRSGDIASLNREPCRCGRTLARMSKVIGRRDDMLVLSGVNVYPSEVERVLLAEPALAPDYLLVVDSRRSPHRLVACCEFRTPVGGADAAAISTAAGESEAIEARLRETLGVGVRVRILPAGTVPRAEIGKAVRVVTWDGGAPPLPGLAGL
jgi:phenylacetate-CoA ligase